MRRIWHTFFLEPVNTLTHLIAALGSLVATAVFILLTPYNLPKLLSLLVFSLSMVILFTASALLHGWRVPERQRMWLNRLDHMAIFLAIAGTYTPIIYNLFPKAWHWSVLLPVWIVSFVGMGFKLLSKQIHGFLNAAIYVILAWGSILPLLFVINITELMPWSAWGLLLLGGIIYTLGFVIYYRQWPDPWPDRFGHHEIWHLFVMGGSLCHFLFMFWYIV
ncbi:MAG: hemolysin III family protein [Chloroflexota bacterium]